MQILYVNKIQFSFKRLTQVILFYPQGDDEGVVKPFKRSAEPEVDDSRPGLHGEQERTIDEVSKNDSKKTKKAKKAKKNDEQSEDIGWFIDR